LSLTGDLGDHVEQEDIRLLDSTRIMLAEMGNLRSLLIVVPMGGSIGPSFDKHEPPLVASIRKEIVLQVSFVPSGRLDNGGQISAEPAFLSFPRIENRNHE
jgi:hypothetical protein